jgi:hypothetical protein
MISDERIVKNRIYVLIVIGISVFTFLPSYFSSYEEEFKNLGGVWLLLILLTVVTLCLALEYIVFRILRKYMYKK